MIVPISKYTSCGNNFVIVDETQSRVLDESEKRRFAYPATNINFGVGADNFLVVQPCSAAVLEKINSSRQYWPTIPDPASADFIFRIFEPDGNEAYSCGNGLMSIASYLFHHYQIESTRIITEIPTAEPKVVSIGTDMDEASSWVKMPPPRRVPDSMAIPSIRVRLSEIIDQVDDIELRRVRQSDAFRFFCNRLSLSLTGYLVFTGEPHLVIFSDDGFSVPEVVKQIFLPSFADGRNCSHLTEKRTASSNAFVDFIGNYFVREFSAIFPVGININFASVTEDRQTIEHRCFERGINHETLACGTGSLASAYVGMQLNKVHDGVICIHPHRCRWSQTDAQIRIERSDGVWCIKSTPCQLFNGFFNWCSN